MFCEHQGCNNSNDKCWQDESEYIKDSPVELATFISLNTVSVLLVLASNSIVLLVIYKTDRLHHPPNFFISSLAVNDLVCGVVSFPIYICTVWEHHLWETDHILVRIDEALSSFKILCTALNIAAISLDRLVAVKWSLRYHNLMKHRTAWRVIKLIWMTSILLSIPTVILQVKIHLYYWFAISIFMLFGPFLVTLHCYIYIIKETTRQQRKHFPRQDNKSLRFKIKHTPHMRKNRKAVKTFLIVIIMFIILFLPDFLGLVHIFMVVHIECSEPDNILFVIDMDWYLFIFYATSFINPMIYAFSNCQFRKGIKSCFCKTRGHNLFNIPLTHVKPSNEKI